MAKKQKIGLNDIGRLAVTPVPTAAEDHNDGPLLGERTLSQYQERLAREEQERREASARKLESEMNEALAENTRDVAAFYSQPIETLLNTPSHRYIVDYGIGDFSPATDQSDDERRAMFTEFGEKTQAVGLDFNEHGWARYFRFVRATSELRNFAVTPEFLQACLERLGELDCWPADEITKGTVPRPTRTTVQAPEETEQQRRNRLDSDLETVSAETREGRRQCIAYLDGVWGVDVRNLYREFADWMQSTYQVDVMQDKVARYFGEFCDRWNANPLSRKTYDEFRRALDKTGWFAFSLLDRDQKLAASIENSDLSDRDVRANIARRLREL